MPHQTADTSLPYFRSPDESLSNINTDDLLDQVAALRDVLNAHDFLGWLIDPLDGPGLSPAELDWKQIGSVLRIVNRDFSERLNAVEGMITGA